MLFKSVCRNDLCCSSSMFNFRVLFYVSLRTRFMLKCKCANKICSHQDKATSLEINKIYCKWQSIIQKFDLGRVWWQQGTCTLPMYSFGTPLHKKDTLVSWKGMKTTRNYFRWCKYPFLQFFAFTFYFFNNVVFLRVILKRESEEYSNYIKIGAYIVMAIHIVHGLKAGIYNYFIVRCNNIVVPETVNIFYAIFKSNICPPSHCVCAASNCQQRVTANFSASPSGWSFGGPYFAPPKSLGMANHFVTFDNYLCQCLIKQYFFKSSPKYYIQVWHM